MKLTSIFMITRCFFSRYLTTGLVIIEATYGPIEQGEELRDLIADVTVPLQALVHNSQLSIPSGRSKVRSAFINFTSPQRAQRMCWTFE